MQLYYSPDYIGAGHDFDTTRKAKWIADSQLPARGPATDTENPCTNGIFEVYLPLGQVSAAASDASRRSFSAEGDPGSAV